MYHMFIKNFKFLVSLHVHINHISGSLLGVAHQETGVLAIVQVYFVDQLVGQLVGYVVDQLKVS